MKAILLVFIISFFNVLPAFAQAKKVAVVKLLRGEVEILTLGKTAKLKVEDWVEDGATIKTAEKSFVKLVFVDKSQMNVGPNSEMKIEKFTGKDSGVIDLVKGKIRSQVSKDYLQMQDKDKSKLFIKTPNAVMGVRGTDFMISTNGANTSTVLFEGDIVFNKLDDRGESSPAALEQIVNGGVHIQPGDFSVMDSERNSPTVPARLNVQQFEVLEKSGNFETERKPDSAGGTDTTKSVVPAGLDGAAVANNSDTLKTEVAQASSAGAGSAPATASMANAAGFVSGDSVKPANGSFIHIDSGVIIPPGPGSVLDKNTNTYIPGADTGKVSSDGNYIPPKNVEITNDGKIMVAVPDRVSGTVKVTEVAKPAPTLTAVGAVGIGQVSQVMASNPSLVSAAATPQPVANDILNKSFTPNGLNDISTIQRNIPTGAVTPTESAAANSKTTSDVTVIVNPTP